MIVLMYVILIWYLDLLYVTVYIIYDGMMQGTMKKGCLIMEKNHNHNYFGQYWNHDYSNDFENFFSTFPLKKIHKMFRLKIMYK